MKPPRSPALKIIVNAKTQRPSTCNTVETLLVHRNIADTFLPALSKQMAESGVTLHAALPPSRAAKRPCEGRAGESGAV